MHTEPASLENLRYEYITDKISDVIAYYRIATEDVELFLAKDEMKMLRKILIYKNMSMDDMKKMLGFDRDIYPISAAASKPKPPKQYER
jgi:N-acyl-D-aspartate/D-glutamate deacylase